MPNVTKLVLARSELMSGLSLWAPKLDKLVIRSCWDLKSVRMLKNAPKEMKQYNIPKAQYSKFDLELIYCAPKINADEKRIRKVSKYDPEDF